MDCHLQSTLADFSAVWKFLQLNYWQPPALMVGPPLDNYWDSKPPLGPTPLCKTLLQNVCAAEGFSRHMAAVCTWPTSDKSGQLAPRPHCQIRPTRSSRRPCRQHVMTKGRANCLGRRQTVAPRST